MTQSFRKINYSLRPGKHAERKMLCEIFRRLRPFQPVEDYAYVGFGSIWFSDFILFHKALGIKDMTSIESAESAIERIEANKPYGAVRIITGHSSDILPKLDWARPLLLWLDYDDPLLVSMLSDIRTTALHALSGTVLAATVQCQQAREVADAAHEPEGLSAINRFREVFRPERVPADASGPDLYGWPFGQLSRRVIKAEVEQALAVRNLGSSDPIRFHSICDIEYEDGAKMTTVVGIFVKDEDKPKLAECGFDKVDFIPASGGRVRIKVPILTGREVRFIERQLPISSEATLDLGAIPSGEAAAFAEFYRYFPNFASIEA